MNPRSTAASLSAQVLAWHVEHGRHDLPWTVTRTPYRVWLSEIMLQQTQVATVLPYFDRFIKRFADVKALAAAPVDDVLHLWSGLGYYSRARNLHRTAQAIDEQFNGEFPSDVETLQTLAGIGRSTAGAIVSLAFGKRAAILDGNVKRVLARYHAIEGWPGQSAVMKELWNLAETHLPDDHFDNYSQAMMDLGATVCSRRKPACMRCPLVDDCAAHANGNPEIYPGSKPRKALPQRATNFLLIENDQGQVLLERRPSPGIWGGLWCFPELSEMTELKQRMADLGIADYVEVASLTPFAHTFSHFRLTISPHQLRVVGDHAARALEIREQDPLMWYLPGGDERLGLSKPVSRLLKKLQRNSR